MISIKDYAKSKNVSYEAVRKQVKRYKDELDGHIFIDNRTQFLDETAVAFLDEKRNKNPIIIQQLDKDEEIERLKNENKELLIQIAQLNAWKAEKAVLIERAEQQNLLLDKANERIEQFETEKQAAVNAKVIELEDKHRKATKVLKEHYDKELEERGTMHEQAIQSLKGKHEAAMTAEMNRKLTIKEAFKRVLGIQTVDDSLTNQPETLSDEPDQSHQSQSADEL